jgi:hypothetical protein
VLVAHLLLAQFQNYYVRIYGNSEQAPPTRKGRGAGAKVTRLLRELSDDETEDDGILLPSAAVAPIDPRKPWLQEFNYYLNTFDQLAENQRIVQWWGVSLVVSHLNTEKVLIFISS